MESVLFSLNQIQKYLLYYYLAVNQKKNGLVKTREEGGGII